MKRFIHTIFALVALTILMKCSTPTDYKSKTDKPMFIRYVMDKLSDVIVYDIFSPPVASRIYAYPAIAAYEAYLPADDRFVSLAGQLRDLEPAPAPGSNEYCYELASLEALLLTGKALVFSEDKINDIIDSVHTYYREIGVPDDVFERSLEYGEVVSDHILEWADRDNYKQTRTFPKYTVTNSDGTWVPTPPAYMEGIEPHWNKIRPFVIDSAQQFKPAPPPPYSMSEGTDFYEDVMEVYETSLQLDDEQKEIAAFWDCNPYVMNTVGHVMYATKKITPGGHWIGIVGLACQKEQTSFMETLEAYSLTSVALMDAFISCWDEKYRSILIRPETTINEHIDPDWLPVLQTPPFPEYTSGHSVISRSAAVMLTSIFGENFHFKDSTELIYGLPVREFDSFIEASEEAAISRLYGGIHYMPAIDEGVKQGELVGEMIVERITTRREDEPEEEDNAMASN